MRVCIIKATGKLFESQSGNDGGLDVLIQNAGAAGYAAADVTASIISDAEFQTLLTASTPAPPAQILSQDLMAQFTADDAAKIQAAVAANPQFWLLWSAMQAQKDTMLITNARFRQGWNALVTVLGQPRMNAIASALGVTI